MIIEEKKAKTIGIKYILGWIIGLLCFFGAARNLFRDPIMTPFGIAAGLVVFPPFMQFVKNKIKIQLSTVLRIILFLVLFGVGIGLSSKISKKDSPENMQASTATVANLTPTPTPIALDMTDFINQYDKNKISAQNKYSGKSIKLTGFIEDILSQFSESYLKLAPTNEQFYYGTDIDCYFVNKSVLIDLSKGQSVTVVGTLTDSSYQTFIELHDCSLIK